MERDCENKTNMDCLPD